MPRQQVSIRFPVPHPRSLGILCHLLRQRQNQVIELGRAQNVKTLLDTDGDALLHGIEAGPTIVKPNQQEAERLLAEGTCDLISLGRALITDPNWPTKARSGRASSRSLSR